MNLNKTLSVSLVAAGVSALAAGTVSYILWAAPASARLSHVTADAIAVTSRLSSLVQANPQLVKLQKKAAEEKTALAKARENWTVASGSARTDDEVSRLLSGQWMGSAPGFSKPVTTRLSREENPVTAKSVYQISVEGSYARLTEYLGALEKSWPHVRVLSAKIVRKDNAGAWRERLDCEVEAFTLRSGRTSGASPDKDLEPGAGTLTTPFGYFKVFDPADAYVPGLPKVTSILFRGKGRYLLAEGKAFREGDAMGGGWSVKEIHVDRTVLTRGGVDTILIPAAA